MLTSGSGLELGKGTFPLDVPYIQIDNAEKNDIPNGKEASFVLKLGSNSDMQTTRGYMLSVVDESNKDGAIVSIDGQPLVGGRLFYVTKGQLVEKTLILKQTKLDVLDYKNIKLRFSSPCDNSIYSDKDISVAYIPSCSDLDMVLDRQIINTLKSEPLKVTLKNFNQEYKNFLGLQIEYKLEGSTLWESKAFAKNSATQTILKTAKNIDAKTLLQAENSNLVSLYNYSLPITDLSEGKYIFRARTLCNNLSEPTEVISNITPEFAVIKDLVQPSSMGAPSPSNGILTPETEMAVTFNEDIQTSRLIPGNFEIKGVLNGAALQHAEGLALDGNEKSEAFTESAISLQNSSFAIEAWVKTFDNTTMGNLFSIGEGADKVTLKMNKESIALFVNNLQVGGLSTITPKTDWQYVSLNYNAANKLFQIHLMSSKTGYTVLSQSVSNGVNPTGRLTIGTGFKGNIHQVTAWSENRSISDLSDMNESKTGKESNIIGYWPMNEGYGKLTADKVRSRNMIVNSSWFIDPSGYSVAFNGTTKQAVTINTAAIPLTTKDDFSIEFWFNGKSQKNVTMFSCGKGTDDAKPETKLSVGINDNGLLNLNTKGVSYLIPGASVLDTLWHHFALSVLRGGNSNVYIDGQQKLQIPSGKIGGLESDSISLGARRYGDTIIVDTKKVLKIFKDQYFDGKMDEVRIWKSALGLENIRLDMRSKLSGDEAGLLAYYPFENKEPDSGNLLKTVFSLKEGLSDKKLLANYANFNAATSYSSNTPGIKIPRSKENVSFSYTSSNNKIIFNIDAPLKKIENCILELVIKDVYDMNGNNLASPIIWTAFVNNNRLNWETEQMALSKEVLVPASFKAIIVNKSGKYENYVIDGLPSWLSVNKSSGRLNPLEKAELSFTVDNSINVGSYESRVTLTGNNGIQEMLPISLKVTGPRPDWAVNPYDFESSMNVIGQIKIEGVGQEDTEDILAAFIGTKCVGIVNPQFDKKLNSYMLYMDVYGATKNVDLGIEGDGGKKITFSLWDAGTGRIYPDVDVTTILFSSGSIIGSKTSPRIFNATDKVEQQLNIKKGWNWLSTNVANTLNPVLSQFEKGMETDGVLLKSKSTFNWYGGGEWDKNITSMDPVSMYSLLSGQPKTLKLNGATAKAATTPITLIKRDQTSTYGWSWIGYIPQFVAPLSEALSGLVANEGDVIKGQMGFATYSENEWIGSLQYMIPGLGYMYGSTSLSEKTFKYPSQYISRSKVIMKNKEAVNYKWVPGGGGQSMTITAVLKIDNVEMTSTTLQIGAFINDECRGVIEPTLSRGKYIAYLSVWGGGEDMNKKIVFKCYNPSTDKELVSADNSVIYSPDETKGSSMNPYAIAFSSLTTNVSDLVNGQKAIYPNPVINTLNFGYNPQGIERLEVVDCTGRTMVLSTAVNKNSIDVSDLIPGIYTLRVNYMGTIRSHRFIKK